MKTIVIVLMLTLTSGCATAHLMNQVSLGMEKSKVIEILGDPENTSAKQNAELLEYRLRESFGSSDSSYAVIMKDGHVSEYGPWDIVFPPTPEQLAARERARQSAAQMYMFMRSQQPGPMPMQPYVAPRPTQTNCQTRWVGGTAQSDCTSQPTGLDASIYR